MRFRFLMTAAALLAACGGAPDAATRDRDGASTGEPRETRRIVFVGTSLTAGFGLDAEAAYPAVIARLLDSLDLNYDVINAGVSGQTSAGTLRQIGWIVSQPFEVLVLETGANDGLRGLSVDSLRANLHAILDSVERYRPDADVFIVGMEAPPNMGARYTARFRQVFPEIARERDVGYIPFLLDGVAGVDTLNLGDGIHPNERGHRRVAENVWRVLEGELRGGGR